MNLTNSKKWICLLTAICVSLSSTLPASSQTSPSWGIHDPSGTGNTLPPNQGSFVRQDPMPKSLEDITIFKSDHKGIKLSVLFPDVIDFDIAADPYNQEFHRYKAKSSFKVIGEVGEPEILHRVFWLQVPYDATNIKIESSVTNFKGEVKENISIYPIPKIVYEENDAGITISREEFYINNRLYQKDIWWPKYDATMTAKTKKHGMKIIRVAVPSMYFNPKNYQLQKIKKTYLDISYQSQQQDNAIIINIKKDPFHKIFTNTIVNYKRYPSKIDHDAQNQVQQGAVFEIRGNDLVNESWASQNNFYPDYLVIAAEIFDEDARDPLQLWANYRSTEQGGSHKIAIAYVHEIKEAYAQQQGLTEEKIRSFISMVYNHWREDPLTPSVYYLLLVGDADYGNDLQKWFLPIWRTDPPNQNTGTAGDNDYVWIEGSPNLSNDILIGRLPAQSEEDLTVMVNKIINFESNPPVGENHYGTRSILLHGDMYIRLFGPTVPYTNDLRNFLISKKQEVLEFDTNFLRHLPFFKYDSNKITDILNTQGALFVSYMGHGTANQVFGWGPPVYFFDLENMDRLPLIVLSSSCLTARFDHAHPAGGPQNSLGDAWLKHPEGGSVCFWGATRNVIVGMLWSQEDFYRAVYENNNHIIGSAIEEVRMNFSGLREDRFLKIANLLGDPAIDFSSHIGESTKPDLKLESISLSPINPQSYEQNMNFTLNIKNNSDQSVGPVDITLFSIESGEKVEFIDERWTYTFSPNESKTFTYQWPYQSESSYHFIPWIDPDNEIDELSKFNNAYLNIIRYYPIYANANSSQAQQFGTEQEPFNDLNNAIFHAISHDHIGDYPRPYPERTIHVRVHPGQYGDGDQVEINKSLKLESIEGALETTVYDSWTLKGLRNEIQGFTLSGEKINTPNIILLPADTGTHLDSEDILTRNIFQKSYDHGLEISHSRSAVSLWNNIFHDNPGTIYFSATNENNSLKLSAYFNTFANNTQNFLIEEPQGFNDIRFEISSNIIWNSGQSVLPNSFPLKINIQKFRNNNLNDPAMLSSFPPHATNMQINPQFMDLGNNNFRLSPNSPCIGKGEPPYENPDGSQADMGAYGGPKAMPLAIKILNPTHGQTLTGPPYYPFDYNLDIEWQTSHLNPNDLVRIQIYHLAYQPAKTHNGQGHYIEVQVVHLSKVMQNTGSLSTIITQNEPNQSYFLKISNHQNPQESEIINFQIMSNYGSIYYNR